MMFPKAKKGVTKIFIAEICSLIAAVVSGIVSVLVAKAGGIENFSFEGNMNSSSQIVLICSIAAAALLLLSGLFKIIGYIQAAGDEEYFTRAIIYAVISIVLYVTAGFLQNKTGAVMEWIYTIGLGNTANVDSDWDYDIEVTAKAGLSDLLTGKLELTKNLVTHEYVKGRDDPATFVFDVEVTKDGKSYYSNVHAFVFQKAGSQSVVIEGLPIGV